MPRPRSIWRLTDDDRASLTPAERASLFLRSKRWVRWVPGKGAPDAQAQRLLADFRDCVRRSMDGDEDAAHSNVCLLNNEGRGFYAFHNHVVGAPIGVRRAALGLVWDHDHRHLLAAVGWSRTALVRVMRAAEFPVPFEGPTVRVYRGTSALSLEDAVRGFSWTTDRDVACWFAMRFAEKNGNPLVLVADVPSLSIVFHHDGRRESEVLLDLDVVPATLDSNGDVESWREAYTRQEASIRAHNAAIVAAGRVG